MGDQAEERPGKCPGLPPVGPSKRLVASSVLASRRRETYKTSCEHSAIRVTHGQEGLLRPQLGCTPSEAASPELFHDARSPGG